jgi:amidase
MSSNDLIHLSALDTARLVRDREVSPVELVNLYLERIERIDPHLHAFTTVTADMALEAARAAEQAVADDAELGQLHGVPIAIKELTTTAGVRSTFSSRAFADWIPEEDDEYVTRLYRAGAIMLGKTNSPEFGLNATTEDGIFPPSRNPWNTDHSTGGSSGGSGAALAARLCPFAEGSDGGGSIRIPSAACGVVGLKPQRGRVPSAPYAGEGWSGFATSGPMARTVADVALGLDVMSGPAVGDPYPTLNPSESFLSAATERPGRLRIAWTATTDAGPVHPEVAAAVEQTARTLADLGHELVDDAPDLRGMWGPFLKVVSAHTAATPVPDPDLLGPHPRAVYDAGRELSAVEFLRARGECYVHTRRVLEWFEGVDVLLCPTLTRPAPRLGELTGAGAEVWDKLESYIAFTFWVNMTGQPAISLPLAMSNDGLPIGVQLVGRQLAERTLISVAAQLEQATPWADRLPPVV